MNSLEQEAEHYSKTIANDVSDKIGQYLVKACYIDGAKSNHVKQEKLKFAKDFMTWVTREDSPYAFAYGVQYSFITEHRDFTIDEVLEEYVKTLEELNNDENTTN